jgi:uncharacterized surface protein with fasciclin (FAS1) repeats
MNALISACSFKKGSPHEDHYFPFAFDRRSAGHRWFCQQRRFCGQACDEAKNIVQNASAAPNLTTLVAAVKAADLVETLMSPGPFTVFAPTNAAFEKLPDGTVNTLLKPENKPTLTKILTYHVVAGKLTAKDIGRAIKMGGGRASLTTVAGEKLSARVVGKNVVITDGKGGQSTVTTVDVMQSNGVVHVIDSVLLP